MSAAAPLQAALPSLDPTLGAALVGLVVSTCLYGVASLQTYRYFQTCGKDRIFLKGTIAALWILDTLHTMCISHAVYYYSITNFGNYLALEKAVWSLILPVGLNCLSATMVQMCFAWRLFVLSDRKIFLVMLVCALSLTQLGAGWAMTIIGFKQKFFADLLHDKAIITTSLISAAVTDILIAAGLSKYLREKRTGFKGTNSLVSTLIFYSVNCGIACSVLALAGLISYLTMPTNLVNFALNFILGKAYSNSLLATLNAREGLRNRKRPDILVELSNQSSGVTDSTRVNVETSRVVKIDNQDSLTSYLAQNDKSQI